MRIPALVAAGLTVAIACGGPASQVATPTPTAAATTATPSPTPKPLAATAELKDKDGNTVATATLTEQTGGVRVVLTATKIAAGQHGWHLHAVGKCDSADFATAGGHFNPDTKQHGTQNPQGPHAGDLGNLTAGADGTAKADVVAKVTLAPGATSLLKTDGTAIVIHANPDDDKTDPSGNSGARIACGVVKAS